MMTILKKSLFLGTLILSLFFIGCKSSQDGKKNIEVSIKSQDVNTSTETNNNITSDTGDKTQEKIDNSQEDNTEPTRNDLSQVEELAFGKADIDDIKKKGGLEVGIGNVYNYGIPDNFKKTFNGVFNDFEKDRIFYNGDGSFSFFYFTDRDYEDIGKVYKDKGFEFTKKINQDKNIILEFQNGELKGQLIYYSSLEGDGEVVGTVLGMMKGNFVYINRNPTEEEIKKYEQAIKDLENK